jgi:hypothetical protein
MDQWTQKMKHENVEVICTLDNEMRSVWWIRLDVKW